MFEQNIINIHGEKGKTWLLKLSKIVQNLAEKWNLKDLNPIDNLSYNYVLSGSQEGQPIILKLNPNKDLLKKEALALKSFKKCGAVSVLCQEEGALLLERVVPGSSLKSYFPNQDLESIEIVCNIIKKLHQTASIKDHSFPYIKDWISRLNNEKDIPQKYREKACLFGNQILETNDPPTLLHGDLHHENILRDRDEWLVIDPQGMIGDLVYEIAIFIRNPMPDLLEHPNAIEIIKNRIKLFADLLNIDHQRILKGCFVQSVISWYWCLYDKIDPSYFKQLTEIYDLFIHQDR